jgi:hypothetical protein
MVSSVKLENPPSQLTNSYKRGVEFGCNNVLFTTGRAWVEVILGSVKVKIEALVLETTAFEILLGMDFINILNGLLFNPGRIIYRNQEYPCTEGKPRDMSHVHEINLRHWTHESYTLIPAKRKSSLVQLAVSEIGGCLFASRANRTHELFCSRENSAWWYNWGSLTERVPWWANPPFSKLQHVIVKVILEQANLVLVTPDWTGGEHEKWRTLLDRITTKRAEFPSQEGIGITYHLDDGKEMPDPKWGTMVSLVDGKVNQVAIETLPTESVEHVHRLSKGFLLNDFLLKTNLGKTFTEVAVQTEVVEDDYMANDPDPLPPLPSMDNDQPPFGPDTPQTLSPKKLVYETPPQQENPESNHGGEPPQEMVTENSPQDSPRDSNLRATTLSCSDQESMLCELFELIEDPYMCQTVQEANLRVLEIEQSLTKLKTLEATLSKNPVPISSCFLDKVSRVVKDKSSGNPRRP